MKILILISVLTPTAVYAGQVNCVAVHHALGQSATLVEHNEKMIASIGDYRFQVTPGVASYGLTIFRKYRNQRKAGTHFETADGTTELVKAISYSSGMLGESSPRLQMIVNAPHALEIGCTYGSEEDK